MQKKSTTKKARTTKTTTIQVIDLSLMVLESQPGFVYGRATIGDKASDVRWNKVSENPTKGNAKTIIAKMVKHLEGGGSGWQSSDAIDTDDLIEVASWDAGSGVTKWHGDEQTGGRGVLGGTPAAEVDTNPEPEAAAPATDSAPEPKSKGKGKGKKVEGDALAKMIETAPKDDEIKAAAKQKQKAAKSPEAGSFELDAEYAKTLDGLNKSDKIRKMSTDGYTPAQISKALGAHYSFVFNVVKAAKAGKKWVNPNKNAKGREFKLKLNLSEGGAAFLIDLVLSYVDTNSVEKDSDLSPELREIVEQVQANDRFKSDKLVFQTE